MSKSKIIQCGACTVTVFAKPGGGRAVEIVGPKFQDMCRVVNCGDALLVGIALLQFVAEETGKTVTVEAVRLPTE